MNVFEYWLGEIIALRVKEWKLLDSMSVDAQGRLVQALMEKMAA